MTMVRNLAALVACAASAATAQTALTYQKPPAAIEQLLEAPPTPTVRLSPDGKMMLVEQPATFPTIADVAQPRYRLAGIRFNPSSNGPSVERYDVALQLQPVDLAKGSAAKPIVGLPAKLKAVDAMWSPDSKHAAFVAHATAPATGLELWVIDSATAHAHRVGLVKLNAVLGAPFAWLPDSSALLCKTVSATRGPAPKVSEIPTGPDVEESLGKVSPAPTYEDMLKTTSDEKIFEYYSSSDLAIVSLTGTVKPLPAKGLIERAVPSPDGKYALVATVHRPFSYTFPYERFPLKTEIVPLKGGAVKLLSDRPAVDNLPISRDAVEVGPRDYQWRADVPATVVWVEAADGGDPSKKAAVVDKIMALPAPFEGSATAILDLPMRLARGFGGARGIEWGNDHLAIVSVARFSDRKSMMMAFDPSTGKTKTLYSGSSQDRYHSPGRPMTTMNATGQQVLKLTADGQGIYFVSPGASPKGDQPDSVAQLLCCIAHRRSADAANALSRTLRRHQDADAAVPEVQARGWRRSDRNTVAACWLRQIARPAADFDGGLSSRIHVARQREPGERLAESLSGFWRWVACLPGPGGICDFGFGDDSDHR